MSRAGRSQQDRAEYRQQSATDSFPQAFASETNRRIQNVILDARVRAADTVHFERVANDHVAGVHWHDSSTQSQSRAARVQQHDAERIVQMRIEALRARMRAQQVGSLQGEFAGVDSGHAIMIGEPGLAV